MNADDEKKEDGILIVDIHWQHPADTLNAQLARALVWSRRLTRWNAQKVIDALAEILRSTQ